MSRPYRILFLIDELHIGGTERQLFYLLRHLDRNRFQPIVCCFRFKGQMAKDIEQLGVKVVMLEKRSAIDPFFLWRLIRFIRREKIQLVQTFLITANLWGSIAARLAGVKFVVTSERNIIFTDSRHTSFSPWILMLIGKLSTRIVGNAHAVCHSLIDQVGLDQRRVICIHNGIEPLNNSNRQTAKAGRRKWGLTENDLLVGVIARLVPQKNIHRFLKALVLLQNEFPCIRGLIVGDGPLREDHKRQAEELGLKESVIFLGERSDVLKILPFFDALVLPSAYEGLPNVVMEAMALGTPVVATRVGGVPELIEDGISGLLVPPHNTRELAHAIKRILCNRVLADQLAEAAHKRISTVFSIHRMVESYDNLYQMLLEGTPCKDKRYAETGEASSK